MIPQWPQWRPQPDRGRSSQWQTARDTLLQLLSAAAVFVGLLGLAFLLDLSPDGLAGMPWVVVWLVGLWGAIVAINASAFRGLRLVFRLVWAIAVSFAVVYYWL